MKAYIHKVQYYETDKMQVTHHSNYIRFMEEARVDFFEQAGYGYDRLEREGIASPVIGVTFDYKKTTTFTDEISIMVSVMELSVMRLKLGYEMRCNGQLVGTGTSCHCFINEKGRPVNIRKANEELYQVLQSLMEQSAK